MGRPDWFLERGGSLNVIAVVFGFFFVHAHHCACRAREPEALPHVIMLLMPRALKLFAVLVLVAVMPLRAVAGVTVGFCASGHKGMAVAAQDAYHGHEAGAHAGDKAPTQPLESSCNICAEHCSSAAFAIPAATDVDVRPAGPDRTLLAQRNAPAFVPDQLDRPPLA